MIVVITRFETFKCNRIIRACNGDYILINDFYTKQISPQQIIEISL